MDYKSYWERNIDSWGEYYLEISHGHETLNANAWLSFIYKKTIGRIEARLMRERYRRTIWFLDNFLKPGDTFCDIGCGTGIFTVEALRRGAKAHAIDFSESALATTKKNVARIGGDVTYHQLDPQADRIPDCDLALTMGVTPYISDIESFLGNVLPYTKHHFCQYTDPNRISNRVRTWFPSLNVRKLVFHSPDKIDRIYQKHRITVVDRSPFATGFIDLTKSG